MSENFVLTVSPQPKDNLALCRFYLQVVYNSLSITHTHQHTPIYLCMYLSIHMTYIYIYSYTSIHSYIYIFYMYIYRRLIQTLTLRRWLTTHTYPDVSWRMRTYLETGGTDGAAGVTHVSSRVWWRMYTYDVCWLMLTYTETGGRSRRRRCDASVYADVCRRMMIYIYAVVCWRMTYADAWRMQKQEAAAAGDMTRVSCRGGREGRRGGSRGVGKSRASRVWQVVANLGQVHLYLPVCKNTEATYNTHRCVCTRQQVCLVSAMTWVSRLMYSCTQKSDLRNTCYWCM
jgi:hypothetical protein